MVVPAISLLVNSDRSGVSPKIFHTVLINVSETRVFALLSCLFWIRHSDIGGNKEVRVTIVPIVYECYVWEKKWFTECNNKTYVAGNLF